MTRRARALTALAVAVAALGLPAAAGAHAYLVRTVPAASATVNTPPRLLSLTYDEAVEPRFAIVSVTDADGTQHTAGSPRRSAADPDTLEIPLRGIREGWYLVYWRAISVDGHPVRGAFTFAVGPNAGPAPQFPVPSVSETAATPGLVVARWISFLALMTSLGLLALRLGIARPLVRRVEGTRLRAVSIAYLVACVVALVAIPLYVLAATADFALRSIFDVGALVPLLHVSAFGRGYLYLELCFALFALTGSIALWLDRPERPRRSVAELVSLGGVVLAAAAVLLVPGLAGHPAETSPRGVSLLLDWVHLVTGSLWIGGLVGLLVVWRSLPAARRVAGLAVAVPRFSRVALVSVTLLAASGVGASVVHLPTLGSLWQTSYGKAILVKVALLGVAVCLAAVNLLRTRPGLVAGGEAAAGAARLLRRLVAGEVLLVAGAIAVAAVLTSLPPPPPSLARIGHANATVGPGLADEVVTMDGYRFAFRFSPNRAAVPNTFSVRVTRGGVPVRHLQILLAFDMLDMEMPQQRYALAETAPGVYSRAAPALVMVGHWGLSFEITPPGRPPLSLLIIDKANG